MNEVVVKPSCLHNHGLFAARKFQKGALVVAWKNTKALSREEFENLPLTDRPYVEIQDGVILLVGEPERYVNHSCEANTLPGTLCDIAARDIEVGEEITADYAYFFVANGPFACRCGSAKCRGLIEGRGAANPLGR